LNQEHNQEMPWSVLSKLGKDKETKVKRRSNGQGRRWKKNTPP